MHHSVLRARRSVRKQAGFTLIELMITMSVSLFGLAGLLAVYSSTATANQIISESGEAVEICEDTMEAMRSMSIADIEATVGYGAITTAGWGPAAFHSGDTIGRNGVIFQRRVFAEELTASASLILIRTEVSWADSGAQPDTEPASTVHTLSLELVRTREDLL